LAAPLKALQDALTTAGARMGEYRGARTAADFGDVAREFAALRSGLAVFDLSWRARLQITGEDRVRWLNGMVTNNVRDLAIGRGVYAFLLNAQGRIQGDLYVYNRDASLVLDTDVSQAARLREIFEKYIIMDDVEITDAAETIAIGVGGPRALEVLQHAGLVAELQPLQLQEAEWNGVRLSIVRSDDVTPSFEIWLAPQDAATVWPALVSAGATPVGYEAVELMRIWSGRPRYGQDIRERDLPQETGQEQRALDYDKGCYVGQEIVERIHSRGAVHRMFTGFTVEGPPIEPGTKISVAGKDVGEITSSASIPAAEGERTVALGYIRREAATPGAKLDVGDRAVSVATLPFEKLVSAA
jgi:folate-binding protein YgfZ